MKKKFKGVIAVLIAVMSMSMIAPTAVFAETECEHSYKSVDNGDGTHTSTCEKCGAYKLYGGASEKYTVDSEASTSLMNGMSYIFVFEGNKVLSKDFSLVDYTTGSQPDSSVIWSCETKGIYAYMKNCDGKYMGYTLNETRDQATLTLVDTIGDNHIASAELKSYGALELSSCYFAVDGTACKLITTVKTTSDYAQVKAYSVVDNSIQSHTWNDGEITTAATCIKEGVKTFTCTVCSATKTETIGKLAHDYSVIINNSNGQNGTHTYKCSTEGCGAEKILDDSGKKTYDAADDAGSFTKLENGSLYTFLTRGSNIELDGDKVVPVGFTDVEDTGKTAWRCEEKDGKTYLKLDGKYLTLNSENQLAVTDDITKASEAYIEKTDDLVGYYLKVGGRYVDVDPDIEEYIATVETYTSDNMCIPIKLTVNTEEAHTWDEGVITTPAKCGGSGTKLYTCTVCGATYTKTIVAASLKHDYKIVNVKEATCTEDGYTGDVICANCGDVFLKGSTVSKLNHPEDEVVDVPAVAATCASTGVTAGKYCKECKAYILGHETIAKVAHKIVIDEAIPATCEYNGMTEGSHCSVCKTVIKPQEVIEETGHTEVVDKAVAATKTTTGLTEGSHCSVCGDVIVAQDVTPKDIPDGWNKIDGSWYLYNNKEVQCGWIEIDDDTYYTDEETGVMQTGWQKIGDNWYYFKGGDSGKMLTGFQKINGNWYYLDTETGAMQTGFVKVGNGTYYFKTGSSGKMLTGWQKIDGNWYYFKGGDSGKMLTGFQKINGNWYYLDAKTGAMQTGFVKVGNGTYYFQPGSSGKMLTGWQKINNKWYYFKTGDSGKMLTGKQTIGGKTYTFDANGVWVK